MKFDREGAGNDPPPGQAGVTSRDVVHPETTPAGSGTVGATAADLPAPVEQRRVPDGDPVRHQAEHSRFQALKAAIQEGLDSGVSDRTIPAIMEDVEVRLRDEGRL